MKKIFSILSAGVLIGAMLASPASASQTYSLNKNTASTAGISSYSYGNYFSGITGKMNSVNKGKSRVFNISSGSINVSSKISSISAFVTVSSGSSPFYLVVEDPSGCTVETYVSKTGTVTISDFNNCNA